MQARDIRSLLKVVEAEQERTARQIASLEAVVAVIVESSELVSTDDEHDPEGATIAYERAQASALLRQARADRDALVVTRRQLDLGQQVVCAVCGREPRPHREPPRFACTHSAIFEERATFYANDKAKLLVRVARRHTWRDELG